MAGSLSAGAIAGLMALSAAMGYGGNMATSAINNKRTWKYTRKAMELQDIYNRRYTVDQYGLMRQGLSQAGYNPLLALGSSASTAMPNASAPNADSDNGSQAITSAIDAGRLANETKIANAQENKIESEIEKINAETRDIENKPRNLITKEIMNYIENGKSPLTESAVSRLKSSFGKKLGAYGLALSDFKNDVTSAISSKNKVYKLKATYRDFSNNQKKNEKLDKRLRYLTPLEEHRVKHSLPIDGFKSKRSYSKVPNYIIN